MIRDYKTVRRTSSRIVATLFPAALAAVILLSPGCRGAGAPENMSGDTPDNSRAADVVSQTLNVPAAAVETPGRPDPVVSEEEAEAPAPGDQTVRPRLSLPNDFPPDVPLLPHRRIRSFRPRENGSVSMTYSAEEGRNEAVEFYRTDLAARGWEVTKDSLSGGMTTLSARQADGSRLIVSIIENPAEKLTMIGLYHRPAVTESP